MSKTFRVEFLTQEEVTVRNYADIEANSAEEAVKKLKEIVEEEGNPYSSNDESIKDIGWVNGNVFDVIVNSNGVYDPSEDIHSVGDDVKEI